MSHTDFHAHKQRQEGQHMSDFGLTLVLVEGDPLSLISRSVFSPCVCTVRSTLQKQQSLPVRPIIPLVARISDQNASGAPPMTVREKSRLDKFKQLLGSPNTDLGNGLTQSVRV